MLTAGVNMVMMVMRLMITMKGMMMVRRRKRRRRRIKGRRMGGRRWIIMQQCQPVAGDGGRWRLLVEGAAAEIIVNLIKKHLS